MPPPPPPPAPAEPDGIDAEPLNDGEALREEFTVPVEVDVFPVFDDSDAMKPE